MTEFGATILDAEGLRLTSDEKALFREAAPFGFILFARNIENAEQLRRLCDELREAAGHECLITIDQEGGRVQRYRAPIGRNWRPALDHVEAARDPARAMYLRGRLIAEELRMLGIDSNCAPLVDIARPDTHPFLRNRCYGSDLAEVIAHARAMAEGHLDGGVVPVMKHMPGHGRSQMDTHFDLPTVTSDAAELRETDFAAFAALSDLPMGMSAHLVFEAFDSRPATLSDVMVGVIRNEMGFDGLLMSDDLSMKALSGSAAELTRACLSAGLDVALYCNADLRTRAVVAEAAGVMTDQALERAKKAFGLRRPPAPLDIEAAEAELSALMGGQVYG